MSALWSRVWLALRFASSTRVCSCRQKLIRFGLFVGISLSYLVTFKSAAQEVANSKESEKKATTSELVAKLDQQVAEIQLAREHAQSELSELQRQYFDLDLKIKYFATQVVENDGKSLEAKRQIEKLLIEEGQWISFSKQIAPIFQDHCVVCHNLRSAKGNYNMATFGNLLSAGQSGKVIQPGNANESLLIQLIVDHDMPQDSPPLSEVQIDLVKKWIDLGARLDSDASPTAALFELAPRPRHPTAPEHYPALMPISAIAVNPAGTTLASSGYHELLLWSLPDGKLLRRIGNVAERVYRLSFLPDGKRLAMAAGTPGRIGEAKVFDSSNGELLDDLLICQDSALSLAVSPDGKRLAVGQAGGAISLFAINQKQVTFDRRFEEHSDWINSLAWSSDSQRIVSSSRDKTSKVFEGLTGKPVFTFNGHQQNVLAADFLDTSTRLVSIGEDRRLRLWSPQEDKQLQEIKSLEQFSCMLILNPNRVFLGSSGGQLLEVQPSDGKITQQIQLEERGIISIAASADSNRLFLGTQSGQILVVDLQGSTLSTLTRWTARP